MFTGELTMCPAYEEYQQNNVISYTEHIPQKKIGLTAQTGIYFVYLRDIICCKAEGNYTLIYLNDRDKAEIVSRTLKEFDEALRPYNFFRIHRSYLINLEHIREYLRYTENSEGDGGVVVMDNALNIPVSRDRKKLLLERISRPF